MVVCRSRLGEGSLHDRTQRFRIVGRYHDSETVESGSITFHEARGDYPRQGGGDVVWTARCVKDVHQELPTDVDSKEPGALFLGEGCMGAVDRPQNLIRTTASEGGPDEGP